MTISNHKQLVDAELEGRVRTYSWRKNPTAATSGGLWFDMALSPGNPPPKYWFDATPGVAQTVSQSADGGLFHGANVSPSNKYLRGVRATPTSSTGLPITMILCDYLLYYPSLDDSTLDPQTVNNSNTLSRYTDGAGVQLMAVTVAGRTGGQTFSVNYTNSDGVAGRVTPNCYQNTSPVVGSVTTSQSVVQLSCNPFLPLQGNDSGVRSVQSVTMNGVDVGLFSLLLVRPLATFIIREFGAWVEKDFWLESCALPIIQDNAFLNFVTCPQSSLASTNFLGDLKVIWD